MDEETGRAEDRIMRSSAPSQEFRVTVCYGGDDERGTHA